MNFFLISAGIISSLTAFGHFTFGRKAYLSPMLESSFDKNAKNTMHTAYHYISVFLVLTSGALVGVGLNDQVVASAELMVKFISLNFFGFAFWQLGQAMGSKFSKGIFKPLQWTFFVAVALLSWFGS